MTKLAEEFKKSENLEGVLSRINHYIESLDTYPSQSPQMPVLLIFGCPRSGTTLFLQWLASLGSFGYPSNLIARFFGNPAFGCEVQKALVDFDKGNQLGFADASGGYSSSLGRTKGALAPSEFWYYWRRFFKFEDMQQLSEEELNTVDSHLFLNGLGAMEQAIGKPLAMKGMMLNWHIQYLAEMSDCFFSVSIQRDLFEVAQSILLCRERYAGNRSEWWSFKPPQYREWLELSPIEQVAAQAVYTQKTVVDGMAALSNSRKLEISYNEFCAAPSAVYDQIRERYKSLGCKLPSGYQGAINFEKSGTIRLNKEDEKMLRDSLSRFKAEAQL